VNAEQMELGVDPSPAPNRDGREPPTPEQRAAIEARDRDVLLEAGAGTGKTRVLVDRYCAAAEESETGVDSILAFTFTERAAGELRHRIREELSGREEEARVAGELDRAERLGALVRDSERAWISTIHGFCRRLLAAHPVALGLDPRFRVIDEPEAERVASTAFDAALEDLLSNGDPERASLVAAMRIPDLRSLVRTAHDELRSQGREPTLPEPPEPDVAGAIAALASAADQACQETDDGPGSRHNLELLARAAELDPVQGLPSEAELAALRLSSDAKAFRGPACTGYKEAWRAARVALAEREASAHYRHIATLVELFARRYRELKEERSGLDFEDLQLEARRLLRDHASIAASYRDRFTHLMVDEFQDTNRLQLELVRLLRGPGTRVFYVGDEFQSIYGFRHADVDVFRRERDRIASHPGSSAEVMRLSGNFRSRPEIVATVNAIGEAILHRFTDLTVGRPPAGDPSSEPAVELLLTPAGDEWRDEALGIRVTGDYPSAPDRIAEARFLAAGLRRVVTESDVRERDIVVLLRAYTHVAAFEEELERAGLRPYVVGGRGYWSHQQVDDVIHLLGAIANPLDDEGLFGVLASPACAVRPDTLWLLRRAAGEDRHVWPVIERRFARDRPSEDAESERYLDAIPSDDAARLRELCLQLGSLRADAPLIGLDELVQRAVTISGYDLASLMMDGGVRRYANARKLMRLARGFESAEGRDLRRFLEFVTQSADVDREGEAATEAEDHDGVRVMTVHAAKGLEFPVVAVADLGRDLLAGVRPPPVKVAGPGEDVLPSDDSPSPPRVGIRLARFGTTAVGIFGYDEMLEAAAEDEAAEACRLGYVAATRAQDRLILSGRYNARRLAKPAEDMRPATPVSERLMRALRIADDEDTEVELPPPLPRPGLDVSFSPARVAVRFNRPEPAAFRALGGTGTVGEAADSPPLAPPPLIHIRHPTEPAARHLSYSALATYGRCGYRFFVERVLGLPPREDPQGGESAGSGRFGFGNAVHAILEWSARHGWREPDETLYQDVLRREQLEPGGAELERARDMVTAWLDSGLCQELRAHGAARPEMPFILRLGDSLVRGTIDLYAAGEVPLVVDYKTDSVGTGGLDELVDRYGVQRAIYALAAAGRAERVRTAYVFLERPGEPVELELDRASLDAARTELEELIAGIRESRFGVTDEPHAALCWDCPARARLCSYPVEMTGRRLR
jgi:ATP-dependent helicase/nuclease subunit A